VDDDFGGVGGVFDAEELFNGFVGFLAGLVGVDGDDFAGVLALEEIRRLDFPAEWVVSRAMTRTKGLMRLAPVWRA
jgi:hypothetical protein